MRVICLVLILQLFSIAAFAQLKLTSVSNICEKSKTYEECVECCTSSIGLRLTKGVNIYCVKGAALASKEDTFYLSFDWFDTKARKSLCGKMVHIRETRSSVDDCLASCDEKK